MLPNWLYGKSKSKLASILGGGGGAPADYNQVKAQVNQNTEDILLLSNTLDDKAALTQITNPNILHNPWFQVNQRGETTMTTNGYFVDRWRTLCAQTGSTTFTLNSDGTITIDNSLGESSAYLIQRRTAKTISRIVGRTITASVMLSDGTVRSGSGIYVDTATKDYYGDDDIKLQSIAQKENQFLLLVVKPGKSITIKALKLEIGSVSTLAMDTAPDMATELLKCQRYFIRLKNPSNTSSMPLALGIAPSASIIIFDLVLPSQMRATPTLTPSSVIIERPGGTNPTGTPTLTLRNIAGAILRIDVTGISITSGASYDLTLNMNGYIDFDAEL